MLRATSVALALIAVVVLSNAVAQGQRDTPQAVPGRYQLYQAEVHKYDILDNVVRLNQKALFKIDTVTGRTYEYIEGLDENGVPGRRWVATTN